jgi:hypothetical protein
MPAFETDGWRLNDGEQLHREAPATFWIPDLEARKILQPGDFVKLIFEFTEVPGVPMPVERMWVIIRERIPGGYIGMLDNEPDFIAQNDYFWIGSELPFEYRHIINIAPGNEESRVAAGGPVSIPWDRST